MFQISTDYEKDSYIYEAKQCYGDLSSEQSRKVLIDTYPVRMVEYSFSKRNAQRCDTIVYMQSTIVASGEYVNKKRDGFWTYRYDDGSILRAGSFKKGNYDGVWSEFSYSHNTVSIGEYSIDRKNKVQSRPVIPTPEEDSTEYVGFDQFSDGKNQEIVDDFVDYHPEEGEKFQTIRVGIWVVIDLQSGIIRKRLYYEKGVLIGVIDE